MKTLVILPTYNEAFNVVEVLSEIITRNASYDICVVDDNSPDGTAQLVLDFKQEKKIENIFLLKREGKSGRGDAVRAGLMWGLTKHYDQFVEMDCDFSHHPKYLEQGLQMLTHKDVVLGSRYPDGSIEGWPILRKFLSYCSNMLIRSLLSWSNADYTNGFRFYNLKAARRLCSIKQEHKGYIYLSETLAILIKENFKIGYFPIVFVNRVRGKSNTTLREITSSLKAIFKIAYKYHFGTYEMIKNNIQDDRA